LQSFQAVNFTCGQGPRRVRVHYWESDTEENDLLCFILDGLQQVKAMRSKTQQATEEQDEREIFYFSCENMQAALSAYTPSFLQK